jgi:uncharacterized iron-regulated membrane protein
VPFGFSFMMNLHSIVVVLRKFRSIHRYVGVVLAIFFLLIALTGLMLGWKKDVVWLQPKTNQGISNSLEGWKSFDEIARAAVSAVDTIGISSLIDRMDVRPEKGIVKVLFKEGYWEAQVDGKSGAVLSVAKRNADWIEHIHDGSIVSDFFKLVYTNIVAIGLFILAISGLWLWYGPKVVRRYKE